MRFLRKTVILGLAAFGAYRVYELLRPRAEQLRATAVPQLSDAVDSAKSTAAQVKDDVTAAKDDVASDLRAGVEDQKDRLDALTDTAAATADDVRADVTSRIS